MSIKEFWLKLPRDYREMLFAATIITSIILVLLLAIVATVFALVNSLWIVAVPAIALDVFIVVLFFLWISNF